MIDGSSEEDSVGPPPPDLPPSLASLEKRLDKESKSNEGVISDSVGPPPEVLDDRGAISTVPIP